TITRPKSILGKWWEMGCASRPQFWGNVRPASILSLQGSSNVQIQCLEVTDHSGCIVFGPDAATKCNRDVYPYGPCAENGVVASDSQNVLFKNVNIHGLRRGILGGRLTNWTLENTDIIANSFV